MNNDRIISYEIISPKDSFIEVVGDFQKLKLNQTHSIRVTPAYFREYGRLQNPLVVRINVDKKISFKNLASVTSKEFGNLKSVKHEFLCEQKGYDALLFMTSLNKIEPLERKNRILKDTMTISMGELEYKFAPKKSNKGSYPSL